MRIESEVKLGFKDVMFRPKRSTLKSRSQVSLERTFKLRHAKAEWNTLTVTPIIAANMDTVGTFGLANVLAAEGLVTAIHKHYTPSEWNAYLNSVDRQKIVNHIMISTGTGEKDFEKLKLILNDNRDLKMICIDVANGYSEHFVEFVKKVRGTFNDHIITAGNVVTGEMVEELILAGADIIKVGIGPGSVCTTRIKTGVGYPQVSAIIECADAAHGLKGLIIADGGCTCPGDVSKAFGAGADFVMLGGMLAGHTENGGDIFEKNGKQYVKFYGMSSQTAMEKHAGGVAEYRASEGKTIEMPFKGEVAETLKDILGGVRSTCTYVGAETLKELTKRTTFIRVNEQENRVFN